MINTALINTWVSIIFLRPEYIIHLPNPLKKSAAFWLSLFTKQSLSIVNIKAIINQLQESLRSVIIRNPFNLIDLLFTSLPDNKNITLSLPDIHRICRSMPIPIRDNLPVFTALVTHYPMGIAFASERLRANRRLALITIGQNKETLPYFNSRYTHKRYICLIVLKINLMGQVRNLSRLTCQKIAVYAGCLCDEVSFQNMCLSDHNIKYNNTPRQVNTAADVQQNFSLE